MESHVNSLEMSAHQKILIIMLMKKKGQRFVAKLSEQLVLCTCCWHRFACFSFSLFPSSHNILFSYALMRSNTATLRASPQILFILLTRPHIKSSVLLRNSLEVHKPYLLKYSVVLINEHRIHLISIHILNSLSPLYN